MKVYKFTHAFCPSCPAVERWLPGACAELGVALESVNVLEQPELASRYQVQSVPTVIVQGAVDPPIVLIGSRLTKAELSRAVKKMAALG
jgi:hypothetical protein